ncbi:methyltransferase domain-containing protein [candidate division KSB1 bacterium]|nr:methyltransferase domain-containing protein [candidate division KSB1 bacterium]
MKKYTWDAKDYQKHSQAQLGWAQELIEKLNLEGFENILDLGCGDGKITAEIARHVPDGTVLGIDNSLSMINLSKKYYPIKKYRNLAFRLMDVTNLSFLEEFDVIFSNAALHWVKDHRPVLEGVYKALKPGGRILIQMGGRGNAGDIISSLDKIIQRMEWDEYLKDFEFPYGFYDTDEYTRLLQKTGFKIKRVELLSKDMVQDGRDGLAGWIRTTWLPYTDRVPEGERDKFIDELTADYLNEFPLDEYGKAHVAMVRLEVEAGKS